MKRNTVVALTSLAVCGLTFASSRADWLALWWRFLGGVTDEVDSARRWSFESKQARHPSFLGGLYQRTETVPDGSRIVTLLPDEHAELAPGLVGEARGAFEAFEAYARRFGAIDGGVIGIVEIHCRDSSYHWAAEGIVTFDRGALSGRVPVLKVAHEIAHLWWGQSAEATGPGERLLTEGLAEFSAWSHLLDDARLDLVRESLRSARRDAHRGGDESRPG